MELSSEEVWLLGFFHLHSRTRFAEHYSKMTSKKQEKYILYIKKKRKKIEHRCSNVSCRIFNTFFFLHFLFSYCSQNISEWEHLCHTLDLCQKNSTLFSIYISIGSALLHVLSIQFLFGWRGLFSFEEPGNCFKATWAIFCLTNISNVSPPFTPS